MTVDINKVELIELVELYAEEYAQYNGYVRTEGDLNERFLAFVVSPEHIKNYIAKGDDAIVYRAFANFAERLVNEGLLHQVQADEYQYQSGD